MDPVTVLMGGLSAIGAAIGEQAIADGYQALKSLLAKKFGASHPRLPEHVQDFVSDPDTYAKPMEKALRDSGAAQDADVVGSVTQLVEQANAVTPVPAGLIGSLHAVQSNIAVVGRDLHGGITFGSTPPRG